MNYFCENLFLCQEELEHVRGSGLSVEQCSAWGLAFSFQLGRQAMQEQPVILLNRDRDFGWQHPKIK